MSNWNFDNSHSEVSFVVRHMVFAKVRGQFTSWSGKVSLPDSGIEGANVELSIDAASINTREEKRDAHLRSADFFDVENHPKITFKSSATRPVKGDRFAIEGALTIHGVTKNVVLDCEDTGTGKDPWGQTRRAFRGQTSINRTEFGLKWNQALELGGVLVSEEVVIEFEVQLVKA